MAWLFTEVFLHLGQPKHGYSLVPLLTFRCWLIPCGSRGSVLGGMSTVDCRSIVPGSCKWGSSGSNLYSTKYLSLIILRVAQGFSDYWIQGCSQVPPNTWICGTFPFLHHYVLFWNYPPCLSIVPPHTVFIAIQESDSSSILSFSQHRLEGKASPGGWILAIAHPHLVFSAMGQAACIGTRVINMPLSQWSFAERRKWGEEGRPAKYRQSQAILTTGIRMGFHGLEQKNSKAE